MALTLRQIDAFRAVMMAGTLTEAAHHLGISQPAISRLIADMEAEINYQLFERNGRRVTPTAEAEILIDEVKRALIGMDQIRETALEIGRFRYARLRLLTIPTIPSSVMARLVREFARRHPDTFVSVEVKQADLVVECVTTQQCDLALVGALPESQACLGLRLMDSSVHCAIPTRHPLAEKTLIEPEDLNGEAFISFRSDHALRSDIDALFESHGVNRLMRYEVRTPDVMYGLVGAGLGISLTAFEDCSQSESVKGVAFRPIRSAPKAALCLAWSRHRELPAMAQAFITIAGDCLKAA